MYFSSNIKILRKRIGKTQDEMAVILNLKRPTYSGYENNISFPTADTLLDFSNFYKIAIDTLFRIDFSKLTNREMQMLENGTDVFINGSNLRVLVSTVDSDNCENIELVTEKAKAGYRTGYADPEYISVLPAFQLPFLSREKKYRTFQICGDSMLPIPDGAYVTGEFVQSWETIRDKHAYIFLTYDDGIVFKVAENNIQENGTLTLHSLNPMFKPYVISVKDLREVWKFVNYISPQLPEVRPTENELLDSISELKEEVKNINNKLSSN
ncbi:MAG: LexA family transcriptional regulator [Bacteroidales bacterium]|nr:LexA family transcriptional regulator [Bacteroidales bacterium]